LFTWDGTRCRNRFCRYGSDEPPEIDTTAVRRERFLSEGGRPAVAAWVPGWYELDPPLEVGQTDEFAFWRVVPDHLRGPEPLVLYNTLWHPEDAVVAHGTIAAIRHPELGAVRKVDTRGLDYTITLADGTELRVEAEETPGVCYERRVTDWRFVVVFESLSEPQPAG
jgi:hypothetical protein